MKANAGENIWDPKKIQLRRNILVPCRSQESCLFLIELLWLLYHFNCVCLVLVGKEILIHYFKLCILMGVVISMLFINF